MNSQNISFKRRVKSGKSFNIPEIMVKEIALERFQKLF